jgi:sortase A
MGGAWRWIRIVAGTLVVLTATGASAIALGPRSDLANHTPSASVRAEHATVTAPSTVAAPLPIPAPTPGNGWTPVPIVAIGDLSIPKIALATPLYEGVNQPVLAVGPGHWPGTAAPGGYGNMVIAGHRSTHGSPFLRIAELVAGDVIVVNAGGVAHTYAVTGSLVVTPEDMWIIDQHPGNTLTIFSCHPIGSSAQRYVVTAQLIAS